uniref:Uncharacterized protein n=1 Tax=Knipowitschia caucasica TaxID=637954 RepID=A0AAV2KT04_KNICA
MHRGGARVGAVSPEEAQDGGKRELGGGGGPGAGGRREWADKVVPGEGERGKERGESRATLGARLHPSGKRPVSRLFKGPANPIRLRDRRGLIAADTGICGEHITGHQKEPAADWWRQRVGGRGAGS